MKKLDEFLHIKIGRNLKQNAKEKAEKEKKGLSKYVRDLIIKDLREN